MWKYVFGARLLTLHASVILASKSFLTLEYLSINARYSSSNKQTMKYDQKSSKYTKQLLNCLQNYNSASEVTT